MTAIAVRPDTSPAVLTDKIAVQIRDAAPQFRPFLPAGTDVEQVVAAVFLECQRVPQLLKCNPASIVAAASRLVQWGFDIGRTGYLVPFGGVCTPVPGFKGLIEMVLASGAARSCDAREVYAGDFFEYTYGSDAFIKHVPCHPDKRGAIRSFYVVWGLRFGYSKFDVMSAEEVDTLRRKFSKQWNSGPLEPWYGIKTVIRRSAKQLPQNPKLAKFFAAMQADEVEELGSAVLSAGAGDVAPTTDRPTAPVEETTARAETGEAATEPQIALIDQLSSSHHFGEKERGQMQRKVRAMTKQQAAKMIDGATGYVNAETEKERALEKHDIATAAENGGVNPRADMPSDDDLPF